VIRPAQREVGRLWQRNEISIAQEHMATAISHLALADLYQRDQPARHNGKTVIVACVEGELHDFPARLVADELEMAGFNVRFLGASVPADTLVSFVARENPDLLVLSATMASRGPHARHRSPAALDDTGRNPDCGWGQICEWIDSFGVELGVEISGCDATELVRDARALLGVN
jgi:hypothetical protein